MEIMKFGFCILLDFFHWCCIIFKINIFCWLERNNFLTQHFNCFFLIDWNLFMFTFYSFILSLKKIILSSQSIILFIKFIDMFLMGSSYLIKLIVQIIYVLLILILQSVYSLEKLDFCLSLNEENFILKSINMLLKTVLNCLIVFHKLFVSCEDELNLWIFSWQCFIKITNFIHKTFLNIIGQISYIFDSWFCLIN